MVGGLLAEAVSLHTLLTFAGTSVIRSRRSDLKVKSNILTSLYDAD